MSRKQEVYVEIMDVILPYMRNIQRDNLIRRIAHGTFYPELELVHNLGRGLLNEAWTQHDVRWINTQARIYIERGNKTLPFYPKVCSCIIELVDMVPEDLKYLLNWCGPSSVKGNAD